MMLSAAAVASPRPAAAPSPVERTVFPQVDVNEFRDSFNVRPFTMRHSLADHPLFRLDRLVELSRRLPESSVEYNQGDIAVGYGRKDGPRNGLSIEETISRIETCNSWMVLKNVERDREFKRLLDDCLDELRPLSEESSPGMFLRMGFVFVSSPNSMTPFHIDPENNFLLQIRGTKRVAMFDQHDRTLASQEDLEILFAGGHRNLEWRDEFDQKAKFFDLKPGEALHFPVHAPHYVKNGGEPSVSFSITFQTAASDRRRSVHWVNRKLRRIGVKPAMPGVSRFADRWKFGLYAGLRACKKVVIGARKS